MMPLAASRSGVFSKIGGGVVGSSDAIAVFLVGGVCALLLVCSYFVGRSHGADIVREEAAAIGFGGYYREGSHLQWRWLLHKESGDE